MAERWTRVTPLVRVVSTRGMAKTSTSETHDQRCPRCGEEFARDLAQRGFVRHKARPSVETMRAALAANEIDADDFAYFTDTGHCPRDRGERDRDARGPERSSGRSV